MKNFGKLKAYKEIIKMGEDILDQDGNVIAFAQTATVMVLKDKNGVEWHDLFKQHPHAFYIVVDDESRIIAMSDDAEENQIADHDIIGIDEDFGHSFGPGGSVYGKIWNGEAIVDPPIDLTAYTAEKRWQKEVGGIIVDGLTIATDDRAKMMLANARIQADNDPAFTTQWKGKDGVFVTLDAKQIITISDAVLAHVAHCFEVEATVLKAVNAGEITTSEQIDALFEAL